MSKALPLEWPREHPTPENCKNRPADGGGPLPRRFALPSGPTEERPMPMPDTDATSPKHLRDKYAIVGVGETTYTRGSGITTRAMGSWAVRNAIEDAGLKPADVDGMLSYQSGDSTFSTFIAGDLGMRVNFYMDVFGGGSSTEALVGIAIGLMEAGMCKAVA